MKLNVRKQPNVVGTFLKVILYSSLIWIALIFAQGFFDLSDRLSLLTYSSEIILGIIALLGVYGIVSIIQNIKVRRHLARRQEQLVLRAMNSGLKPSTIKLSNSLYLIAENKSKYRNHRIVNSYISDDWGFGEYQFSSFRKSKHGTYDTATFHFAIGIFTLPRKLPNVFFDSHRTGGNEFKLLFDASQKHSLESVFDNYFTAYFHEDYTVDNLSFITPEVMEALIAAQQYDIEIYEDKLYLYNELENMPGQLDDIERAGSLIREKLLNNIVSYRDQRIAYVDGRKTVSMLGLSLKRSLKWTYVAIGVSLMILLPSIIIGLIYREDLLNRLLLYAIAFPLITLFSSFKKIIKIKREEKVAFEQRTIGA